MGYIAIPTTDCRSFALRGSIRYDGESSTAIKLTRRGYTCSGRTVHETAPKSALHACPTAIASDTWNSRMEVFSLFFLYCSIPRVTPSTSKTRNNSPNYPIRNRRSLSQCQLYYNPSDGYIVTCMPWFCPPPAPEVS